MAQRQLMRLLLVDGDGLNRYAVSKALQRVGYLVEEAASGEAALERYDQSDFDLVLAEIALPGISGIELLQGIRRQAPDAVVILLSEDRDIETAVQALRSGAQDYLLKPCSSDEIRESVERGINSAREGLRRRRLLDAIERNVAELARTASEKKAEPPPVDAASTRPRERPPRPGSAISLGDLSILPGKYQIVAGEQAINLTPTEFDLLLHLAAHSSRVVPCSELVREVRGYHSVEADAREVIRPHVSNLRRKLKRLGDIELIVNVRGVGYRLGESAGED